MIHGEVVTVVDLGSTLLSAMLLECHRSGELRCLALQSLPAEGVAHGELTDVALAHKQVEILLEQLAQVGGRRIRHYCLVFNGASCYGMNRSGVVPLSSPQRLTAKKIDEGLKLIEEGLMEHDCSILHNCLRRVKVDGKYYREAPLGMPGKVLEVESHVMLGKKESIDNLLTAFQYERFQLSEIISGGLTCGYSVLKPKQRDRAYVVIDFGYGKTSITLFYLGVPFFSKTYALGTMHVIHDVSVVLEVPADEASRLVQEVGSCQVEPASLSTILLADGRETPLNYLNQIILARVEEIFLLLKKDLGDNGIMVEKTEKVVFCGGGAALRGLEFLAEKVFTTAADIGTPTGIVGQDESWHRPNFASLIGASLYVMKNKKEQAGGENLAKLWPRWRKKANF